MRFPLIGLVMTIAVLCIPFSASAQSYGTIAVSPAKPTTNDSITVTFTPTPGQLDLCPLHVTETPTLVFIISNTCPIDSRTVDHAVIGKLPAGTYQLIWGVVDNFFNVPEPTTTLVVSYAPPSIPTLTAVGTLLLIGAFLCLVAFHSRHQLGPNYSLKRTAADGLR